MVSSIAVGSHRWSIPFWQKSRETILKILEYYKRLLRLETEKRHARIETATAVEPQIASQISLNLARRYGTDLTHGVCHQPGIAWRDANSRRERCLGQQRP